MRARGLRFDHPHTLFVRVRVHVEQRQLTGDKAECRANDSGRFRALDERLFIESGRKPQNFGASGYCAPYAARAFLCFDAGGVAGKGRVCSIGGESAAP